MLTVLKIGHCVINDNGTSFDYPWTVQVDGLTRNFASQSQAELWAAAYNEGRFMGRRSLRQEIDTVLTADQLAEVRTQIEGMDIMTNPGSHQ